LSLARMAKRSRQRTPAAQTAVGERNPPRPPTAHWAGLPQRPAHGPGGSTHLPGPRRPTSALESGGGGYAASVEQSADSTRAGLPPLGFAKPFPGARAAERQESKTEPGP